MAVETSKIQTSTPPKAPGTTAVAHSGSAVTYGAPAHLRGPLGPRQKPSGWKPEGARFVDPQLIAKRQTKHGPSLPHAPIAVLKTLVQKLLDPRDPRNYVPHREFTWNGPGGKEITCKGEELFAFLIQKRGLTVRQAATVIIYLQKEQPVPGRGVSGDNRVFIEKPADIAKKYDTPTNQIAHNVIRTKKPDALYSKKSTPPATIDPNHNSFGSAPVAIASIEGQPKTRGFKIKSTFGFLDVAHEEGIFDKEGLVVALAEQEVGLLGGLA